MTELPEEERLPFEKAQQKTKQPQVGPPREIAVAQSGLITPSTHTELHRVAKMLFDTGALPKSLNNPETVLMAMQMLRQLNVPDIACLRQTCCINGQLSIWGDLPLAIVRRSGNLESIDEFFFLDDYERVYFEKKNLHVPPFGAYCSVKRKGDERLIVRTFTVEDAKMAGLLGKSGPWQNYRKRMLQLKARSLALKDVFSDSLYGVAIAENDFDSSPVFREVSGGGSIADELNEYGEASVPDLPQKAG